MYGSTSGLVIKNNRCDLGGLCGLNIKRLAEFIHNALQLLNKETHMAVDHGSYREDTMRKP